MKYLIYFIKTFIIISTIMITAYIAEGHGKWWGMLAGFIVAYPIEAILLKIVNKIKDML